MTTVNILYFPGTNCQRETVEAFRRVGARPRLVFATDVLAERTRFDDADLLCIPGGFCYGDHIASGVIAAKILTYRLGDQLARCRKKPIIAICNGFQIAVRAGLFGPDVALTVNQSGTFRHVRYQEHIVAKDSGSLWLKGLEGQTLRFPCAHGEGRFIFRNRSGWKTALSFPERKNPDGATDNITGITSEDGLLLGLMDHPERARDEEQNLEIFSAGVRAVQ